MELLQKYGYSLVFVVMLLEQLGLPIPVAPVLILAGALCADGKLSLALVLLFATVAAFIGDYVWFMFGKKRGHKVLRTLCALSLSPESCVKKTESSFLKYGMNSLLFSKFVPGLNTIAPPMAGLFHGSFLSFFWRDLIGILLYAIALTLPGFFFEKAVFDITAFFEGIGKTLFWLVIAILAGYALFKYLRLKILQRMLARERITPQELQDKLKAGEAFTIVDLRTNVPEDKFPPISGAIRISPGEIDQHLHRLEPDRWIVMYCT